MNTYVDGGARIVPEVLTVAETAIELRTSAQTVKRWIRDGRLEHVLTPGGRKLVPIEALSAMRLPSHVQAGQYKRDRRA